jgi:ABC-2 type transport system ATP-binding protein
MQVRHYSSGMYIRLGFAVAVNVEPEILLVDEVLSVGDEAFQRKCLDRVTRFQKDGRTILFVTHAADLIRRVCDRAIVLEHGRIVADAAPGEAVRSFRESLLYGEGLGSAEAEVLPRDELATHRIHITNVVFDHPGIAAGRTWLLPDEPLSIRLSFAATEPTDDVQFGIAIHDVEGRLIFGANTRQLGYDVHVPAGPGEVVFEFERVPLMDGTFLCTFAAESTDEVTVYDWQEQRYSFAVMNPSRLPGLVSLPIKVRIGETT